MTFEEWWENQQTFTDEYKIVCEVAWEKRVPEGFVIVPVEPTEAMINAGWLECNDPIPVVTDVYNAMIKAAQEEE